MAIDWASSSEDEFPDLDEVLARAKANKLKTTQTAPVPTRRGADRSRGSQAPKIKTPVSENEDSEQSSPDREEVSTRTVVRRRRLGPRTDSVLSKPLAPSERKGKSRSDDLTEKVTKMEPKIKVRPLRATKGTSTATRQRERAPASSQEDGSESSDGMSDFIINTDDESDAYSETSPQPKMIKSLPAMQPSRSTRQARDTTRSATPEKKDRKPASTQTLPPVRMEPRRKLKVPPTDSLADALGRLDISTSLSAPERQQTPPNTPPRAATNKKTLVSPQKLPAIPQTPHRPSMDLFWDQEFFNEWNEEHSPRKLFLPKVSKTPAKSPAKEEKTKVVANRTAKKLFESRKHQLADSFLRELDGTITEGQIARLAASTGGVKIQWSKTLNTTAGRANWKRETIRPAPGEQQQQPPRVKHHASIELAEKVISDDHRLLNVLAHEFCHLANFMITGITTNPHGKEFKAWAAKVSRAFADRDIEVTTKHSYEIDFKYVWTCGDCALEYKRHSKSINPERHRCGACKGTLLQTRPVPRGAGRTVAAGAGAGKDDGGKDKASAAKKEPTEYQRFVKEHMRIVREENPGSPQKDMMRFVAEKWSKTRGVKASRSTSREASVESVVAKFDDLVL